MKKVSLILIIALFVLTPWAGFGLTLTAEYDDLGRLKNIALGGEDRIDYTYDDNGNLTVQTLVGGGATPTPTPTQGEGMTPTPCSPLDLSEDCVINALDLIVLIEQSENVEDFFEFSTVWQEDLTTP